jgi:hypothetical protein
MSCKSGLVGYPPDHVVLRTPPAEEGGMVDPAFAGDHEDVLVRGLFEAFVRPDDDGVAPLEIAKPPPAGQIGAKQPLTFAAPEDSGTAARVRRQVVAFALGFVGPP